MAAPYQPQGPAPAMVPNINLFPTAPSPALFGAAAAQQGQAVQQIEGLVGQRRATQVFMGAAAGAGNDPGAVGGGGNAQGEGAQLAEYTQEERQFLDEQAWWQQNYGT